jgi:hypothetical protein
VLGFGSESNEGRDCGIDGALEAGDSGSDGGSTSECFEVIGEPTAHALVGFVSVFATDDGSNDCGFVHSLCELWEDFADLDTGYIGCDGAEFTSDFGGGFGFDFPHILVWGATAQEYVDETFVGVLFSCGIFCAEEVSEGKASESEAE